MRAPFFILMFMCMLPLCMVRPFIGILLFSWFSFMNPHQQMWDVASDLPYAQMVIAATVIGCFVAKEPRRLPQNTTNMLIVAFMVFFSITTLFCTGPYDMVLPKYINVFKIFLVVLLTSALLTDKYRIHALIWIMVVSLGYYGLRGGAFVIAHGGSDRVYGPPNSMIADNNHIAAALLVALPLMNYVRLQSPYRHVRTVLLGVMLITLFAVVGSYSRGALIGLASVAIVLWFKSRNKMISGVVLVIALAGVITFMPEHWFDRMASIEHYNQDSSANERIQMWREAWGMALARPLTGAGFSGPYLGSVVQALLGGGATRAVHSIYFEVIGEHGFIGFAIWMAITISGLINTSWIIRTARKVPDLQWAVDLGRMAQVSIVAYMTAGAFLSLSYWDYYFTMLVAVAATRDLVAQAVGVRVTRPWQARGIVPAPDLVMTRDGISAGGRG